MNYRHAFHAGNFADVHKHGALLQLLKLMTADAEPLDVIETHAGAGRYDLTEVPAERTGEAAAGVARLRDAEDAPEALKPLAAAVARANPGGELKTYPGSPALISRALRPQDRYVACEIREDDHAALKKLLLARANAEAVLGDGWKEAVGRIKRGRRTLILVDPPFEFGGDGERAARLVRDALRVESGTVVAVWLPIKDLEGFDAFVRALEAVEPPPTLISEARLRPLDDPMRMNGSAMVVVNAPDGLAAPLEAIGRFVGERLGEEGEGSGRLWRVGAPRPAPEKPAEAKGPRKPVKRKPGPRTPGAPNAGGAPARPRAPRPRSD